MKNEEIIIFGIGNSFNKYEDYLVNHYEIAAFIDNNVQISPIERIPIYSVVKFPKDKYNCSIYISSKKYYMEMRKQLLDAGIDASRIIDGETVWAQEKRAEQLKSNELAMNISKMLPTPFSRVFGTDRGTPIDRIYIERFLKENSDLIKGDCVEIAENTYTNKYGTDVKNAFILHVEGGENAIKGDLVSGEGIKSELVDCAIITQTLMFLNDLSTVSDNIYRMLKHGGNALVTVAGISQISRFDADRWGHFYGFYPDGVKALFSNNFKNENISICTYGNVKLAMGYLYGMCAEDFDKEDFEYYDEHYPMIIGCILHKE